MSSLSLSWVSKVRCILASITERGASEPEFSFSRTRIAGFESVSMATIRVFECFSRARAIPSNSPSKWVAFVPRYSLPDSSGCLSLSVLLGFEQNCNCPRDLARN